MADNESVNSMLMVANMTNYRSTDEMAQIKQRNEQELKERRARSEAKRRNKLYRHLKRKVRAERRERRERNGGVRSNLTADDARSLPLPHGYEGGPGDLGSEQAYASLDGGVKHVGGLDWQDLEGEDAGAERMDKRVASQQHKHPPPPNAIKRSPYAAAYDTRSEPSAVVMGGVRHDHASRENGARENAAHDDRRQYHPRTSVGVAVAGGGTTESLRSDESPHLWIDSAIRSRGHGLSTNHAMSNPHASGHHGMHARRHAYTPDDNVQNANLSPQGRWAQHEGGRERGREWGRERGRERGRESERVPDYITSPLPPAAEMPPRRAPELTTAPAYAESRYVDEDTSYYYDADTYNQRKAIPSRKQAAFRHQQQQQQHEWEEYGRGDERRAPSENGSVDRRRRFDPLYAAEDEPSRATWPGQRAARSDGNIVMSESQFEQIVERARVKQERGLLQLFEQMVGAEEEDVMGKSQSSQYGGGTGGSGDDDAENDDLDRDDEEQRESDDGRDDTKGRSRQAIVNRMKTDELRRRILEIKRRRRRMKGEGSGEDSPVDESGDEDSDDRRERRRKRTRKELSMDYIQRQKHQDAEIDKLNYMDSYRIGANFIREIVAMAGFDDKYVTKEKIEEAVNDPRMQYAIEQLVKRKQYRGTYSGGGRESGFSNPWYGMALSTATVFGWSIGKPKAKQMLNAVKTKVKSWRSESDRRDHGGRMYEDDDDDDSSRVGGRRRRSGGGRVRSRVSKSGASRRSRRRRSSDADTGDDERDNEGSRRRHAKQSKNSRSRMRTPKDSTFTSVSKSNGKNGVSDRARSSRRRCVWSEEEDENEEKEKETDAPSKSKLHPEGGIESDMTAQSEKAKQQQEQLARAMIAHQQALQANAKAKAKVMAVQQQQQQQAKEDVLIKTGQAHAEQLRQAQRVQQTLVSPAPSADSDSASTASATRVSPVTPVGPQSAAVEYKSTPAAAISVPAVDAAAVPSASAAAVPSASAATDPTPASTPTPEVAAATAAISSAPRADRSPRTESPPPCSETSWPLPTPMPASSLVPTQAVPLPTPMPSVNPDTDVPAPIAATSSAASMPDMAISPPTSPTQSFSFEQQDFWSSNASSELPPPLPIPAATSVSMLERTMTRAESVIPMQGEMMKYMEPLIDNVKLVAQKDERTYNRPAIPVPEHMLPPSQRRLRSRTS